MFVIQKTDSPYNNFYVAPPGSEKSYVKNLQDARSYPTRDAANADRCVENERVVDVNDILHR